VLFVALKASKRASSCVLCINLNCFEDLVTHISSASQPVPLSSLAEVVQRPTCENLFNSCLTRLDSSVGARGRATRLCSLSNSRPTSQQTKTLSQQGKCTSRTSSAHLTRFGLIRAASYCSLMTPRKELGP